MPPDRWEKYSRCGTEIADTRIIPIKTPLRQSQTNSLENRAELQFSELDLVERFTTPEGDIRVGLVVNLTAKKAYAGYYNPDILLKRGIQYAKLLIPGHETPSKELMEQFCEILDTFYGDPDMEGKLVAVHCTHGVNRTGYLVCAYLILRKKLSFKEAISAFAEARGHSIERSNYLDSLQRLALTNVNKYGLSLQRLRYDDNRNGAPVKISSFWDQDEFDY